jgi:hypothetical protein
VKQDLGTKLKESVTKDQQLKRAEQEAITLKTQYEGKYVDS